MAIQYHSIPISSLSTSLSLYSLSPLSLPLSFCMKHVYIAKYDCILLRQWANTCRCMLIYKYLDLPKIAKIPPGWINKVTEVLLITCVKGSITTKFNVGPSGKRLFSLCLMLDSLEDVNSYFFFLLYIQKSLV